MLSHLTSRSMAGVVIGAILLELASPGAAAAQFSLRRTAVKVAVCAGGAYGGYKLGEKLGSVAVGKMKAVGAEADRIRKAFQIGMAAALCGTGVLLTNTVYARLSKRDREAREKEMDAALADAGTSPRAYVLPDSKLTGNMTAQPIELDDDGRECRVVVDELAGPNEPAMARFCRKPPKTEYELDY